MTTEKVEWLVHEVEDLLDAGAVGLYEFIWLLRGVSPGSADAELKPTAIEALNRIRDRTAGELVWLVWPNADALNRPLITSPAPTDWDDPQDGTPYLALRRL
jgi:hypothetical protein